MKAINGVSRRAFLGLGATAAAGAAAMGLIGCSPKADSKSSTTDSASGDTGDSTPSFLQKPETIPASDIKETVDVDIVIIGAGHVGNVGNAFRNRKWRRWRENRRHRKG